MNKNELKKIRDEIITLYNTGKSAEELCILYNAKWSDIYDMLSPALSKDKVKISLSEKNQIKNMYLSGLSSTKIGIKLKIHHKTINSILDDFGIPRKGNGLRKYSLNESYFDVIDNQNKAYILGLLYADGYNSLDKKTIRLQLQEEDCEILEKIRVEIKSTKPLKYIKCDNKIASNGFISKNMYQLEFYSSHICHTLNNIGMYQNKSLILDFPKCLDETLYSHFIRGYFDGDGSYSHRISPKYGERDVVTITSTKTFCDQAKKIINIYSQAKGGGIYDASCHNGITKVLSFSGKNQTKNFFDWIYNDAQLYIQRKFNLYHDRFIVA